MLLLLSNQRFATNSDRSASRQQTFVSMIDDVAQTLVSKPQNLRGTGHASIRFVQRSLDQSAFTLADFFRKGNATAGCGCRRRWNASQRARACPQALQGFAAQILTETLVRLRIEVFDLVGR